MCERKILALSIAAFLQAVSKQSGLKNVKTKSPPCSHSSLQPVLAQIVSLPCQLIVSPQTSSCSFASQHINWETESCWIQRKEETIDFKTVGYEQNILNLCCSWHLWWKNLKILFPCHSPCSSCLSGFFLSLDSEVEIVSVHVYQ